MYLSKEIYRIEQFNKEILKKKKLKMAIYFDCGFIRVKVLEDIAKIHYTRKSERITLYS